VKRLVLLASAVILASAPAFGDVRTEGKTQVKFEGILGRMINMFGGGDPMTQTVSVKGNRKATLSKDNGQIIDLTEEKIYELDLKRKTYTVTTFAELRRKMEEARQKAASQAPPSPEKEKVESGKKPEFDVQFSLKESGQRKPVNGFDAREVVMTVSVTEKGKTLEQSGGMVMTSNTWLAAKVPGMNEIAEFDRRYAEKLASMVLLDAQTAAMAAGMYPMMADAMKKMQAENVNLDGTPVLTVVKMETVASAEQAKAAPAKQEESRPTGLGALGGRLARRVLDKGDNNNNAAATPGRALVMTIENELVKVTPSAVDAELAIPADFKLR
jgi:hypothetical protein